MESTERGFAYFGSDGVMRLDEATRELLNRDRHRDDIVLKITAACNELIERSASRTMVRPLRATIPAARVTYDCRLIPVRAEPLDNGVVVTVSRIADETRAAKSLASAFHLTAREAEVAVLLQTRHTNQEIAERLAISCNTARHHVQRIMRKMDVRSRREVRHRITSGV